MENKWEMLKPSDDDREKIWGKSRTFAGDVWYRFRKKPTAIAGFVIIVILLILSFAGPLFTKYSYSAQNLEVVNIPPLMKVFDNPDGGYWYIDVYKRQLQRSLKAARLPVEQVSRKSNQTHRRCV